MSSEAREGSFPDLLKISENTMLRRNDSELAFQEWVAQEVVDCAGVMATCSPAFAVGGWHDCSNARQHFSADAYPHPHHTLDRRTLDAKRNQRIPCLGASIAVQRSMRVRARSGSAKQSTAQRPLPFPMHPSPATAASSSASPAPPIYPTYPAGVPAWATCLMQLCPHLAPRTLGMLHLSRGRTA